MPPSLGFESGFDAILIYSIFYTIPITIYNIKKETFECKCKFQSYDSDSKRLFMRNLPLSFRIVPQLTISSAQTWWVFQSFPYTFFSHRRERQVREI